MYVCVYINTHVYIFYIYTFVSVHAIYMLYDGDLLEICILCVQLVKEWLPTNEMFKNFSSSQVQSWCLRWFLVCARILKYQALIPVKKLISCETARREIQSEFSFSISLIQDASRKCAQIKDGLSLCKRSGLKVFHLTSKTQISSQSSHFNLFN